MAETITPSTPANQSSWTNNLNSLLTAGSSIFTGIAATNVAAANAKAAKATAAASTANAQQQSGVMKYVLIGGGVLVAVVLVIILVKRK